MKGGELVATVEYRLTEKNCYAPHLCCNVCAKKAKCRNACKNDHEKCGVAIKKI